MALPSSIDVSKLSIEDFVYWYKATFISNYDGDTATFEIDLGYHFANKKHTFRLLGINSPEVNQTASRPAGLKARDYLKFLLEGKPLITSANTVALTQMNVEDGAIADMSSLVGSFAALTTLNGLNASGLGVTNLNNFSALTSMGGVNIQVGYNTFLTNIYTGLSGIDGATLTDLSVFNNSVLPSSAQVDALHTKYVGDGFVGSYNNTSNGPG